MHDDTTAVDTMPTKSRTVLGGTKREAVSSNRIQSCADNYDSDELLVEIHAYINAFQKSGGIQCSAGNRCASMEPDTVPMKERCTR